MTATRGNGKLSNEQWEGAILLFHRAYDACNWALDALALQAAAGDPTSDIAGRLNIDGMIQRTSKVATAKQEDLLDILDALGDLLGVDYSHLAAEAILAQRKANAAEATD